MSDSPWAKVKIVSDGTCEGTHVTVEGRPLAVYSLRFDVVAEQLYGQEAFDAARNGGRPGLLTLEIFADECEFDLDGGVPVRLINRGGAS